ncbi:hypothetical protein KSP9073_01551 [Kushneria phyllosphaerae]|uniref:Uncharacterized protein n=1 Tax=Kushneria phyllosphaerae TaxID=2100822 RepID=A0A2R8CL53_9GAMM|nr:hypothetical protein KSP9073_01551 [Kushneria phyllosphaerae]
MIQRAMTRTDAKGPLWGPFTVAHRLPFDRLLFDLGQMSCIRIR